MARPLDDSFDLSYTAELRRLRGETEEAKQEQREMELERLRSAGRQQLQSSQEQPEEEDESGGFFHTLTDMGEQLLGGIRDAGVETAQTAIDFGGMIDSGVDVDDWASSIGIDVDDAETGAGTFTRTAAQFLTGFLPALGAMRALKMSSKVAGVLKSVRASGAVGRGLTSDIAKYTVAGAAADFAVFDPHEARASNLAKEFGFENVVTDYLAADENDSEAEGRLKNVLEGASLGLLVDGVVTGARFMKRWRNRHAELMNDRDVILPDAVRAVVDHAGSRVTFARQHLADLEDVKNAWRSMGEADGHTDVGHAREALFGQKPLQSEAVPEGLRDWLVPAVKVGDEILTEGGERGHYGIADAHFEKITNADEADLADGFLDTRTNRFNTREEARRLVHHETASPEARGFIDGARIRASNSGRELADEFEDYVRPWDETAKRESTLGQIDDLRPELANTIRRATANTKVLDEAIDEAAGELGRAEQAWADAVADPSWRTLPLSERRALEAEVERYRPQAAEPHVERAQEAVERQAPPPRVEPDGKPAGPPEMPEQTRPARDVDHPLAPQLKITRAHQRAIYDAITGVAEGRMHPEELGLVLSQDETYFARMHDDESMQVAIGQMAGMFTGKKGSLRTNHELITHEQSLAEANKLIVADAKKFGIKDGPETILGRYLEVAKGVRDARAVVLTIQAHENGLKESILNLGKQIENGTANVLGHQEYVARLQQFAWFDDLRRGMATDLARGLNALGIKHSKATDIPRMRVDEALKTVEQMGGAANVRDIAVKMNAAAREGTENAQGFFRGLKKNGMRKPGLEFWINAILSGPITHAVNIISNTAVSIWRPTEALITGLATGNSQRIQGATRMYGGMLHGFKVALRMNGAGLKASAKANRAQWDHLWNGTSTGLAQHTLDDAGGNVGTMWKSLLLDDPQLVQGAKQFDVAGERAWTGANFGQQAGSIGGRFIEVLGTVINLPSRLLTSADELAKTVNYYAELNRLAYDDAIEQGAKNIDSHVAELVNDVPRAETLGHYTPEGRAALEALHEEASQYARAATFTDELPKGFSKTLQNSRHEHPWLQLIAPFVRTPVNIMKFVGERTPGIHRWSKRVKAEIKAGQDGTVKGHERMVAARARLTIGTGIWMGAVTLGYEGKITGGGPRNPDERAALMAAGWQPYSIRSEDAEGNTTYHSINRLDPIGMFLGISADVAEILGMMDVKEADELGTACMVAVTKNLTSKSYFTGITAALDALNNPDRKMEVLVQRYAGSVIPNFFVQGKRTGMFEGVGIEQDDLMREVDGWLEAIRSRTPGFGEDLPPRRNLYGDVITYPMGLGPDTISPVFSREASRDPAAIEIGRLASKEAFGFSMRRRFGMVGAVELTSKQKDRFIVLTSRDLTRNGMTLKVALSQLVQSERYQRMGDGPDGRPKMLSELISKYRARAKRQLLQEDSELAAEVKRTKLQRRLESRQQLAKADPANPAASLFSALN